MGSGAVPAAMGSSVAEPGVDWFALVANSVADATGEVIRKYFRRSFEIVDKDDLSPVTIADRAAEESMVSIILKHFPSHAIYGEENGWRCREYASDYVWVLDPIDGKPVFRTLLRSFMMEYQCVQDCLIPSLRYMLGWEWADTSCWIGLYTTSPHLFSGDAAEAFARVRGKVKVPLYGCDCYAYALLASGFVDLVVESGLKPYDFLSLVPVIEGAGGLITDWKGQKLHWKASPAAQASSFNALAAGDREIHGQALELLQWQ